jgi:prophage regulatory protein
MAKALLREPQVLERIGLSHSTLWKKVGEGLFPAPVRLDPEGRAVAWVASEIDDFIEAAIKRRDTAAAAAEQAVA